MTKNTVFSHIDQGIFCLPSHTQTKVVNRQTYVQPDGGFHYLHRSIPDSPPQPIITLFRIVDRPSVLEYKYLRQWKYYDSVDLLECPHCRQKLADPIGACRFEYLADQINWLAECPTCRGWSIVTG